MGVNKRKFQFKREDGSVLGHGLYTRNLVNNIASSQPLDSVTTTRKSFQDRFGDLRLSTSNIGSG